MPSTPHLLTFALIVLGMVLTPGPNMIYLVSRSLVQGRLAALISLGGVAVGFVQVDGVAVALETLSDGWHAAEHNDGQRWRWTNGAAAISLPGHAAVLDVTITATLPYARAAA